MLLRILLTLLPLSGFAAAQGQFPSDLEGLPGEIGDAADEAESHQELGLESLQSDSSQTEESAPDLPYSTVPS